MTARKILEDLAQAWLLYQGEYHDSEDDDFLTSIATETILYLGNSRKKSAVAKDAFILFIPGEDE